MLYEVNHVKLTHLRCMTDPWLALGIKCVLEDSGLTMWLIGAETNKRRQRLSPRRWLVGLGMVTPPPELCHKAKQRRCGHSAAECQDSSIKLKGTQDKLSLFLTI